MHTSNGKREGDSKKLRETTETMETSGDALQCRKENKRQLETDRDQRLWGSTETHSRVGRRVRDSRRLRETKETGGTEGTNGDAQQQGRRARDGWRLWRPRRLKRLWRPLDMYTSKEKGMRFRDSWRLRETKETEETLETTVYAHK